jgi:ubiquitin carboxyl-terminal hydrolase 48
MADRSKYMRELDTYAGLVNLGATCYINTYLQVWFNNPFFRETILKIHFELSKHENGSREEKSDDVIEVDAMPELRLTPDENLAANLKMIFLLLKYSTRKSIDPNFFIKALNLDENMQQVNCCCFFCQNLF